jgi:hypothetical protein
MNRRTFLKRTSQALAGAVLAAHLDFGSLIPVPTPTRASITAFDLESVAQPIYDFYSAGFELGTVKPLFHVNLVKLGMLDE